MIQQFIDFVKSQRLFDSSSRILLAVSGGADSMAMFDLFMRAGYPFAVAHCNFRLRGAESDKEEAFVTRICDEHNIELFVQHFDTEEFADQEGISIEMAARKLRYDWFDELLLDGRFDYLATAHHQDDVIETFLINLSRGTGLKGLCGIRQKTGKIIRPMLFTNREGIREYLRKFDIPFCEDSSNQETIYYRNFIRHQILPLFDELNPAFRKNVLRTILNLNESSQLFEQKIEEISQQVVRVSGLGHHISIEGLMNHQPIRTVLFELIRPYGFQPEQVDQVLAVLESDPGRKFYSETHRLVKDRSELVITRKEIENPELVYIEKDCLEIHLPVPMKFQQIERTQLFRFSTNPMIADLDLDKLEFPLILRKWKEGEYFQPLGMNGFKKLSDFFIDEKLSIPEKESTWILVSGDKVCWVVGRRIDDRFKIGPATKKVFRISAG